MERPLKRRMPAEWEQHEGTLIAWPHNKEDWPGKFAPIDWVYAEIVRHIEPYENVHIVVKDDRQRENVSKILTLAMVPSKRVKYIVCPTDRSWMRDSAPAFVYNGRTKKREAIAFRFNGWAKYPNWKNDLRIPENVARALHAPLIQAEYKGKPVVLEGGAIDVNGKGTLLTTEECLLHPKIQTRNPGFKREDYAAVFREYLGVTNIIWLKEGIIGDDTHGHIDDLARFVTPDTIVICREKNRMDENYRRLEENVKRLRSATLENGKRPLVLELPMPKPVMFDRTRLPASYANFLITNGSVLVPTFNDPNDTTALSIIADLFPKRAVVGIHALDLVWGLGTLHCLSHEIPEKTGKA